MRISNIDHSAGHRHRAQAAQQRHHAESHTGDISKRKTDRMAESDRLPEERSRSVIRLLEAGHFKGVADVRLRINFFNELSSRAAEAATPVVDAETASLAGTVSDQVDALIAGFDIDEATSEAIANVIAEFETVVQESLDAFKEKPNRDVAAYAASLQAAFDGLITKLTELLQPPPDESDTATDPEETPDDGAATKPVPNEIAGEIGNATASLLSTVDSVRGLAPRGSDRIVALSY